MPNPKQTTPKLLELEILPSESESESEPTAPAEVVVLNNPATSEPSVRARAPFVAPDPTDVARIWQLIRQARLDSKTAELDELTKLGGMLYKQVVPEPLAKLLKDTQRLGSVQLHLKLREPQWQRLPLEAMAIPPRFLACQANFTLSRHVFAQDRDDAEPPLVNQVQTNLSLPLRLLIVVSSPLDLEPNARLDADREVQLIRAGLRQSEKEHKVEIELEDETDLDRLRATLAGFNPHVVHFTGHGFFDDQHPTAPRSGLVLQNSKGDKRLVSSTEIASVFAKCADLQVVVLSACKSAIAGSVEGLGSTAEELVRAGIPAVVAMQHNVRDDTATRFAHYFYPALLAETRQSLGLALSAARGNLFLWEDEDENAAQTRTSDWALPALLTAHPTLPLLNFDFTQEGVPRRRAVWKGDTLVGLSDDGYFVGRQLAQRQLRAGLVGGEKAQPKKLLVVTGHTGVGKTSLVTRVLSRLDTNFDFVYQLNCELNPTFESLGWVEKLAATLKELKQPQPALAQYLEEKEAVARAKQTGTSSLELDWPEVAAKVAAALGAGRGGVLVLDNFENWLNLDTQPLQYADPKLQAWLDLLGAGLGAGSGRVIITSRYDLPLSDKLASTVLHLTLEELSREEALRLMAVSDALCELTPRAQNQLYDKEVNTPQLISWANADLKLHGHHQLDQWVLQRFSEKALLERLYGSLPLESQTLLRRSAVYQQPVIRDFLTAQCEGLRPESISALLERKFMRLTTDDSVDTTSGGGLRSYSQHAAVRSFGKDKLAAAEGQTGLQAAHQRAGKHYEYFADWISHELDDYQQAVYHYLEGAATGQAARLVRAMNRTLGRKGYWRAGLALNAGLNQHLKDHPALVAAGEGDEEKDLLARADLLKNEAYFRRQLGEVAAAIPLYEKALGLVAGGSQAAGAILGNLGLAYGRLGDYHRAIEYAVHASLLLAAIKSPALRQALNTLQALCIKAGRSAFEGWATLAYQQLGLGLDYTQYRQAVLEPGGVFAPLQLTEYQQSLVQAFTLAAMGHTQSLTEVRQWLETQHDNSDWTKLVPQIERLLAGERQASVLLHPQLGLDEVDHTIIETVLDNLANPLYLLDEGQQQIALVLGAALQDPTDGDAKVVQAQARQLLETQILPQLEQADSDYKRLAVVIRKMLAGERNPSRLLAHEHELDEIDQAIVRGALELATDVPVPVSQPEPEPEPEPKEQPTATLDEADLALVGTVVLAIKGDGAAVAECWRKIPALQQDVSRQELGFALVKLISTGQRDPQQLKANLNPHNSDMQVIEAILNTL